MESEPEYVGKVLTLTKAAEADITKCACGCNCEPGKPDPECDCQCSECQAARGDESEMVEKRDMDPAVGGGVDRDKIPAEDFAGPNRSFPIVKPGDVSDAASSLGRAKGNRDEIKANIIRIAHRKGQAFVDQLPDAWKSDDDAKKGAVAPTAYELQRLHDLVCGGLDWATVEETYPSVTKNGVAAALGSPTMGMIYQMLAQEVAEDGGNGSECDDIHHLAGAYKCVCEFLNNEAMEDAVMAEARADLVKDAAAGRTYYTTAARDQAKAIMAQLHDHIAAVFPDLCPMTAQTQDEVPVIVGNQDDPGEKSATADKAFEPTPYKKDDDETVQCPKCDRFNDTDAHYCDQCGFQLQGADDVKVDGKVASVEPELTKLESPDLSKLIASTVAAAIDEATARYTEQIKALQAQIDQLGAEPDPARAPLRGMTGLAPLTKGLTADTGTAAAEAQKRAAERDRQHEIALMRDLADHSTSDDLRFAAAQRLAALQQL